MKILCAIEDVDYNNDDMEMKKQFIRDNGLDKYVRELNTNSTKAGAISAINWVYDQHTLSDQEFFEKYYR